MRLSSIFAVVALIGTPASAQSDFWSEATSIDLLNANSPYVEKRYGPAKEGEVRNGSGYLTYVIGRCQVDVMVESGKVTSYSFDVKQGCATILGGEWPVGRIKLQPGLTFADVERGLQGESGKFYATCLGNCSFILGNAADPSYGFRFDGPGRTGISIEFDTDYAQGSLVADRWEVAIRRLYGVPDNTSLPVATYECRTTLEPKVKELFGPLKIKRVTVSLGEKMLGEGRCGGLDAEVAKAKREGPNYLPE